MNDMLLKLYVKFQDLKSREEGQDLVEYALVVALIAFGATAGMGALAGGIQHYQHNPLHQHHLVAAIAASRPAKLSGDIPSRERYGG